MAVLAITYSYVPRGTRTGIENDCGTEEIIVPKCEVPTTSIRDAHKNIEVLPCKSVYTSFATVSCFYHQLSLSTIRSDDVRACKEQQ